MLSRVNTLEEEQFVNVLLTLFRCKKGQFVTLLFSELEKMGKGVADLRVRFPVVCKDCLRLGTAYIENQSFVAKLLASKVESLSEESPYMHSFGRPRLREKSHSVITRSRKRQKYFPH